MFLRNDSEAIKAACEAFASSAEDKTGEYRWPGSIHMEAAVDAYLKARGGPVAEALSDYLPGGAPAPAPRPITERHNVRVEHGPWETEEGANGRESSFRTATLICDQCGVIEKLPHLYSMLDPRIVNTKEINHNINKLWEAYRV